MKPMIPLNKMSKKKQKEFYSARRITWNGFDPVTRVVPNGKGYNRNKIKQDMIRNGRSSRQEKDDLSFFFF